MPLLRRRSTICRPCSGGRSRLPDRLRQRHRLIRPMPRCLPVLAGPHGRRTFYPHLPRRRKIDTVPASSTLQERLPKALLQLVQALTNQGDRFTEALGNPVPWDSAIRETLRHLGVLGPSPEPWSVRTARPGALQGNLALISLLQANPGAWDIYEPHLPLLSSHVFWGGRWPTRS